MAEARSVKNIFNEARDLAPADRAAFVDRVCGHDAALRAQVNELLALDENAGAFLAEPTDAEAMFAPIDDTPGRSIGPYRLLDKIGEGGFGVIFLAEQSEPVERRVAIKIIKLGMDTREVIARFEAERQALALMDHPNIARVLDAGATPEGRPYFVMEFVRGLPITDYCDRNNLDTGARLRLFTDVCRAIQHAHQKGIIHRDIKPSNVLVTDHDDEPVAKVIDFGIAKAVAHRLTAKTVFTEQRQLIGTPEYMSPEQAEMSGLDVDTRTDVYALGVLLYELLSGTTPFDPRRLRSAAYAEIQRIIREEEPPKPSTRSESVDTARHRSTDPASLRRQLRGDLDWIVMKALAKDRTRRYATPVGLADDVLRHLADEPVTAGPPGAAYRVRKLARRHRGQLVAAAAVAGALALGAIWAVDASIERREKNAARKEADAVTSLLIDAMLMGATPGELGPDALVRDVLDRAADRLEHELDAEPAVRARLRGVIGRAYLELGLFDAAKPHLDAACAFHRDVYGDADRATLRLLNTRARLDDRARRSDEALAQYTETLALLQDAFGDDDADTLNALGGVGLSLMGLRRFGEAEDFLERTLAGRRRVLGDDHELTSRSVHNLGGLHYKLRNYTKAEPLLRESLMWRRAALGDDDPKTLVSMDAVGKACRQLDRFDDAIALHDEAVARAPAVYGREHGRTLVFMTNRALAYRAAGRWTEALEAYARSLERHRAPGADRRGLALNLAGYGLALAELGRGAEAVVPLTEARPILATAFGPRPHRDLAAVDAWLERLEPPEGASPDGP